MPQHEASKIPIEDRVAYATVVGSMAAADHVVAVEELKKLRALCDAIGLGDEETTTVITAAECQDEEASRRALEHLKTSDLKFTLLTDCLFLAYADGKVVPEEEAAIRRVAEPLGISGEQLAVLRRYVEETRRATEEGASEDHLKALGEKYASDLAAVGVPVASLALCSAAGLTVAGIATGTAALLAGLGIATGVGAVVGLGLGTVVGMRWLCKKIDR